ncbi:MAG: HTTM domain-containing protein [Planctomycetaceae bacterium]
MNASKTTLPQDGLAVRIERFFHATEVPYAVALVRIVLPLVLLLDIVPRWPVARELFSSDGAPAQLSIMYGRGAMLPELPGGVVVALFSLLGLFLVTTALGWFTRLSVIAATVLYFYFTMLDAVSSMTKYTVIANHGLFLLALSNCGGAWSIDAWRERARRAAAGLPRSGRASLMSAVWPRRLMQILIGVVYFGAAVTKMHTPAYFSGDQLMFWMITQVNSANPLGNYMTMFPALLVVAAYFTIVWELLFLFLAWRGWSRALMIALGVMFHVGTMFLLGLYVFPLVCFAVYFAFFDERPLRRFRATHLRSFHLWMRRARLRYGLRPRNPGGKAAPSAIPAAASPGPRRRIPATAAFAFSIAAVAIGAVEVEYRLDPYGVRQAGGPQPLREISQERVAQLFTPSPAIHDQDLIFSFEIGDSLFAEHLVGRREEFRHGERLLAQVKFNPPHGDLVLECNLHDGDNHVIHRFPQVVTREMLRANWPYQITRSLVPGDYQLVLKNAGREVERRRFRIAGDAPGSSKLNAN